MAAQLAVIVQRRSTGVTPFEEPTRAIVLSAQGCLITLSMPVRCGERLIVRNVATGDEQDCLVVYVGERQGGRAEVGLRLASATPQFWGLKNPPPEWGKS